MPDDPAQDAQDTGDQNQQGNAADPNTELQRIRSWLGRVEKSVKDLGALGPAVTQLSDAVKALQAGNGANNQNHIPANPVADMAAKRNPQSPLPSSLEAFNEDLYRQMMEGDVMGALQRATDVMQEAQTKLRDTKRKQVDDSVSSLTSDPVLKDFLSQHSDNVKKTAYTYAERGYSPLDAVKLAVANIELDARKEAALNPDNPVNTGMLEPGRGGKGPQSADKKLPPQFEAAYQRDKEKGLFKDRNEYIANLSPRVREQFGITLE